MKKPGIIIVCIICLSFIVTSFAFMNEKDSQQEKSEKLLVVWTSGDKEVAMKMVFMYVFNAKKYKWWNDIELLVWGPSSKLLSEDKELQDYIKKMKEAGINLSACKACADMYKVSDKLTELGITVKYKGVDLTENIKGDSKVITF